MGFKEEVDVRYIPEARLDEAEEKPPRVVGGGPRLGGPPAQGIDLEGLARQFGLTRQAGTVAPGEK